MSSGYSPQEERLNILSHGTGAVLALVAWFLLVAKALASGLWLAVFCVSVFGGCLFVLYLASTLYHSAQTEQRRLKLKVFDHSAIYLLIAGTYTPFTLLVLQGSLGYWLFAVSWAMAAVGIVLKLFFTGRFTLLSTAMYLAMGWLIVFATKPLVAALAPAGLHWLLAGGISYTVGAVLYSIKRIPYNHAIFHGFVLLASFCHVIAVYFYVI